MHWNTSPMMLVLLLFLPAFADDTLILKDANDIPMAHDVDSTAVAIRGNFMSFKPSGQYSPGTPSECWDLAVRDGFPAFGFHPRSNTTAVNAYSVFYTEQGVCSMLEAHATPTYIHSQGEFWVYAMNISCPKSNLRYQGYKAASYTGQIRLFTATKDEEKSVCLAHGRVLGICYAMPLEIIGGKQIAFRNTSDWNTEDTLFCGMREGACKAGVPIYESIQGKNFLYADHKVDEQYSLKCWGWSHDNC